MAKKQVFLSFAHQDRPVRDHFVSAAAAEGVPFGFTEMSVKKEWDEQWRVQCRYRIRSCDALIALITAELEASAGALWEIRTAGEIGVPILGVYAHGASIANCPEDLLGKLKADWNWEEISRFIARASRKH